MHNKSTYKHAVMRHSLTLEPFEQDETHRIGHTVEKIQRTWQCLEHVVAYVSSYNSGLA